MRALAAALLSCACAASAQGGAPVVVGAVVPQSGFLADAAAGQARALALWVEQVNARGGVLGRPLALALLDDASEAARVPALYEALVREHRAELLVGPFGSAATLAAAGFAERARRVLMNVSGAARAIQRRGTRYVFQVSAPATAYAHAVLGIARGAGVSRLFILARDDPRSRELAARLRTEAEAAGVGTAAVEVHAPGVEDFAAQIARARAAGAEAWIAFGLVRDAAAMTRSLRRAAYAPALFLAQGAADPAFLDRVGQDAELVLGFSAWEPQARTPGNAEFVRSYEARWGVRPDALAAAAYAAGVVLEEAVRRAGSLEPERLREALASLEVGTPLGTWRVGRDDAQAGVEPLVLQIQRGRREIVWPEGLATARWQFPFPPWEGRRLLE